MICIHLTDTYDDSRDHELAAYKGEILIKQARIAQSSVFRTFRRRYRSAVGIETMGTTNAKACLNRGFFYQSEPRNILFGVDFGTLQIGCSGSL